MQILKLKLKLKLRVLDSNCSNGLLMTIIHASFEIILLVFGYIEVIIIFILKDNSSNNNSQLHNALYLCI